ncbi:unnamed protein product [Protopolystoma xenopodis]|uniref:Uncharacterized protein n=1 Tax=Protopolystoma xenopodis TaxID=117903 RepID=A0A448WPX3_9PLAT|nr:unnamed protein product [Protopolystoma xenopodis]
MPASSRKEKRAGNAPSHTPSPNDHFEICYSAWMAGLLCCRPDVVATTTACDSTSDAESCSVQTVAILFDCRGNISSADWYIHSSALVLILGSLTLCPYKVVTASLNRDVANCGKLSSLGPSCSSSGGNRSHSFVNFDEQAVITVDRVGS